MTYDEINRFRWQQSADGNWQRNVDEAEGFYASLCRQREDAHVAAFPITFQASFAFETEETFSSSDEMERKATSSLRNAWLALRHECPTIASWIQYDQGIGSWKRVYSPIRESHDSLCSDSWLSATFQTFCKDTAGQFFNTNLPVSRLATLFVAYDHAGQSNRITGEVYFRSPHDLIDGIGIMQLMNRFFELASENYQKGPCEIRWHDNEHHRLAKPLNAVLGIPVHPTEAQKQKFGQIMAENGKAYSEKPLLGFPISAPARKGDGQGIKRASVKASSELTSTLLKISKLHAITMTYLISAALVLNLRDIQSFPSDARVVRYCNNALVNLRGLCGKPENNSVGNYHTIASRSMAIDISPIPPTQDAANLSEEMISTARQFGNYFAIIRPASSNSDLLPLVPLTWDAFTPNPAAQPPPESPIASVAISSIGNISVILKSYHHPFTVTGAWVAGEPLGTGVSTFFSTFSGELEISAVFDSQFHSKEKIEDLLKSTLGSLTLISE